MSKEEETPQKELLRDDSDNDLLTSVFEFPLMENQPSTLLFESGFVTGVPSGFQSEGQEHLSLIRHARTQTH